MKKNIRTIASAIVTAAVLLSPEGSLPVMASDASDLVQRVEFDDTASDAMSTTDYGTDDSAESSGTSTDLYNTSSGSSYRTLTDGNVTVSGMFPEDVTMTAEDDKDLYSWIAGDGQRVLFAYDVTFKQDGLFYTPDDSDLEYTIAADGYVPSEQKNSHVYHVNGDTKTEVTDVSYTDNTAFTTAESGVFVCVADKPAGKAVQVKRTAAVTGPRKAPSADSIIKDQGESGSVSWAITSDGVLDIWPTNGTSGTFEDNAFHKESDKYYRPWTPRGGFRSILDTITQVKVEGIVGFNENQSAEYMFAYMKNLKTIDVSGLDTSNVTSMEGMFWNNTTSVDSPALQSIKFGPRFDTSKVKNMSKMFMCDRLVSSLDVSNFNTSNVEDMEEMFCQCESLTSLDVSHFNTSKVTTMAGMFNNCRSLISLDVSNFDTSNVIAMSTMFAGCSSLKNIDVSKFNTHNCKKMYWMFGECSSLTDLDISNFDISNVDEISDMFIRSSSLKCINLGNFNTQNVTDMLHIFSDCSSLTTIITKHDFNLNKLESGKDQYMFANCYQLVGGNGTKFDSSHIDSLYAKVDKPGTPGYFTDKIYIHLDTNGGNDLNPGYVAVEYEGTLGILPTPTRDGYTFNGWYTSKDGGTKADPDSKVTKSTTYYAHWTETPKTCTVTWDANGGTVTPSTSTVQAGSAVEKFPTPTRSNYTFDGWYTAKTGGTKVTSGDTISKDVTYYARWSATTYPITYNLDGGAMTGGTNPDIYSIETPTFTLKNPTKDGYTFAGWTGSNGTTPQTSVTVAKGSTGVRSYTAHWTRNTYTVTVPASVTLTRIPDAACGADNYQAEIPIKVTGTVPSSGVTVTTEDGTIHRNDNDKITTALKIVSNKSLKWTTASDTAKNAMASAHITRSGEYSGSVTISFDSN